MPKVTAACICDAGSCRDSNEDNFFFSGVLLPEHNAGLRDVLTLSAHTRPALLLAVFDGMGGASRGERAAFLAARSVQKAADRVNDIGAIEQLLRDAGAEIRRQRDALSLSDMGTTAVLTLLRGSALHVVNVGDSRAYLLRRGALRQLSRDHTDAALLRKLQVKNRRPSLTQYLGMAEDIQLQPHTERVRLRRGDRVLLCSDGLYEKLGSIAIRAIVETNPVPEQALRRLVAVARACRTGDNITAILLRVD